MSNRFSFDDKSLQRYVTDACAELKNTDVCAAPHTFSDSMRIRMSDTLLKERRYRLWQKTKMVLAVLLTLLVAVLMFWGVRNMDEIKLERLFLEKGMDTDRDNMIISTIVTLAKNMNMEVVQEGVENKAMLDRVVGMGVTVIQGYYYAKAIPLEEFKIFIKSNTSIRYKSIVK